MDKHGLFISFLVCKVGMAIAAITLIGAALAISSSFERTAERDELTTVADAIAQAIRTIDGMPGEVQIVRELPTVEQQFWVNIVGIYDGTQVVHMIVAGQSQVERVVMLRNKLNGGEFELSCDSPTFVHLTKIDEVSLELV
jgi:hypothetical protein